MPVLPQAAHTPPWPGPDSPSARPRPPQPHVPAQPEERPLGEPVVGAGGWAADKRASLCSPNKGRSVCAWRWPAPGTQLGTPGRSKGAVDGTREPAGLKKGPKTSVPSGTSPPPGGCGWNGVSDSCRRARATQGLVRMRVSVWGKECVCRCFAQKCVSVCLSGVCVSLYVRIFVHQCDHVCIILSMCLYICDSLFSLCGDVLQ